jgi:hypothetical protein
MMPSFTIGAEVRCDRGCGTRIFGGKKRPGTQRTEVGHHFKIFNHEKECLCSTEKSTSSKLDMPAHNIRGVRMPPLAA